MLKQCGHPCCKSVTYEALNRKTNKWYLCWLCPTTVLASESWLALLVRISGSELVTDSVSLFCQPKRKRKICRNEWDTLGVDKCEPLHPDRELRHVFTHPLIEQTCDPDATLRPLSALIWDFFSSASAAGGRCCFAPSDPAKYTHCSARFHQQNHVFSLPYWVASLKVSAAQKHYKHLKSQSFFNTNILHVHIKHTGYHTEAQGWSWHLRFKLLSQNVGK